jgi:L-fuconolactonase
MTVTDAHCHVSRFWREPVESLIFQMGRAQVDRAVLICAVYSHEWDYVRECSRQHPEMFSFVAAVHPDEADPDECVRAAVRDGAVGVRMRAPRNGQPTDGHLVALRTAQECGVSMNVLGWSEDFIGPVFAELVSAVPDACVVVEHLGTLRHAGEETADAMRRVFELAQHAGIYLKFHGLGEFCVPKADPFVPFPFDEPIPPYLEWAYEAFGPDRLMWGSDYPNVCSREGYERCLTLARDRFAHLPDGEVDLMFDGNARRVFASMR